MTRRIFLRSLASAGSAFGPLSASYQRPLTPTAANPLSGTRPLEWQDELDVRLMDGAHAFVHRKIQESVADRQRHWKRDFSSRSAYEKSIESNRSRFRKIAGITDPRLPPRLERFGSDDSPALAAGTDLFRVWQVRWPVLEGIYAEGLLLEPRREPLAHAVVLTDADHTPEQAAGLAPGHAAEMQFARRLAGNGIQVLVPALIDRTARWSGSPDFGSTDQTHREWIYRQAFHMGRHVIGYEVQQVLAAIDWFHKRYGPAAVTGIAGYGEGGLIAFYAAAADTRISAALVSGYFDTRQGVWAEPIYRNVWGLLEEFGDAEIASLIAPRGLVVEYSESPQVKNQKGDLRTPAFQSVETEFERIGALVPSGFQQRHLVRAPGDRPVEPVSTESILRFASLLGIESEMKQSPSNMTDARKAFDPAERQKRLVKQVENHIQGLVRASGHVRERFFLHAVMPELADNKWSTELRHPTHSPERFIEGAKKYRRYLWEEVLGKFQEPVLPPNARTRRIYDKTRWQGYDVVLDVWPELFAWGVLLLPKDIKPGERRPVVVCQHGRRGLPKDVIVGGNPAYNDFAAKLADRGFIVFAPHNLYRGEDRYRWLDRKANTVKASMFSFILAQHSQILKWLASLPFADPDRIAFYGLSYGGETAVRVPPILEGYCLSICSGDFNNWTRKVAATDQRFSFMYTIEWEMPYFDMGNTFDYAELAYLMTPRPFMVERGHNDRVGRDQWVAHEYAKVRWLYTQLGLGGMTEIEYFNGGHTINGEGTFKFLHKYLDWPMR